MRKLKPQIKVPFTPAPKNRNKTLGILVDYLGNQNFDNAATKNKSNTLSVKNPSVKNFVGNKYS